MLEMSDSVSPDFSVPAVIATKLRVPSPRSEQVLRPRLLEMLEDGLDCKLTLVSAPAGYGKTMLLSQWLPSRISPRPTHLGLFVLARVRAELGDRTNARALLGEARTIVEAYPDAGMFPDLLEHQERELDNGRQREPALNGELTDRELAVLRLFDGDLSHRQIGECLYVSINTIRPTSGPSIASSASPPATKRWSAPAKEEL